VAKSRSRWSRPKPRGFSSPNQETRICGGLTSGRQSHSPLPRHIASPSESWISSRQSSETRRSFSPNWYMLVSGAMPSRSTGRRGNRCAVTSITVAPPGATPKR
jgi:hypothetical protein